MLQHEAPGREQVVPALGDLLQFLLDYVMEFPENNRRELLLSLASGSEE